jgi:hypothetical protein
MSNFLGTEDKNAVDRFLAKPRAMDKDLRALDAQMKALFAPVSAVIGAVPGVPANVKGLLKSNPMYFLLHLVQNGRDFVRELINRVASRSGKSSRKVGSLTVYMKARSGDSLWRTMAQLIMLGTTDWWATHEECLRMIGGLKQGQKIVFLGDVDDDMGGLRGFGELGDGGVVSIPALVTAVGGAVSAIGATVAEITLMLGAVAAIIGALTPVIDKLLDMADGDEEQAEQMVAAQSSGGSQSASGTSRLEKRKVGGSSPVVHAPLSVKAGIPTSWMVGGAAAAAGVGFLIWKASRG